MKITGALLLLCTVTYFCSNSEAVSLPLTTVDCSIYKKYPVVAIPCPITYMPVCGSDYITYGNECHLCIENLTSESCLLTEEMHQDHEFSDCCRRARKFCRSKSEVTKSA